MFLTVELPMMTAGDVEWAGLSAAARAGEPEVEDTGEGDRAEDEDAGTSGSDLDWEATMDAGKAVSGLCQFRAQPLHGDPRCQRTPSSISTASDIPPWLGGWVEISAVLQGRGRPLQGWNPA